MKKRALLTAATGLLALGGTPAIAAPASASPSFTPPPGTNWTNSTASSIAERLCGMLPETPSRSEGGGGGSS